MTSWSYTSEFRITHMKSNLENAMSFTSDCAVICGQNSAMSRTVWSSTSDISPK